jgi:hypothetical protein
MNAGVKVGGMGLRFASDRSERGPVRGSNTKFGPEGRLDIER